MKKILFIILSVIVISGCRFRYVNGQKVRTGTSADYSVYTLSELIVQIELHNDQKLINLALSDQFKHEFSINHNPVMFGHPTTYEKFLVSALEASLKNNYNPNRDLLFTIKRKWLELGIDVTADIDSIRSNYVKMYSNEKQYVSEARSDGRVIQFYVCVSNGPLSGGEWVVKLLRCENGWYPLNASIYGIY